MTPEQIKAKAELEYPIMGPDFGVTDTIHGHLEYGKEQWIAGAEWMQGKMENEACEFADWVDNNYTRTWGEDNKWVITINTNGEQMFYTTSELYQIYKQQKP